MGRVESVKYICKAMDMAEYVITRCADFGKPVADLHLQKMLYFLQLGFSNASASNCLIFRESFYARRYGPVILCVYNRFFVYGGGPINRSFECSELNKTLSSRPNMKRFIDNAIDLLRKKSPWNLVSMTHATGTPWDRVSRESGYRAEIQNDLIVEQVRNIA